MQKNTLILLSLSVIGVILWFIDVCVGSTCLSPYELLFMDTSSLEWQIISQIRIPRALTAIVAGAALSVSGLMMQTLFRNPLAGPYVLGISSGASLGVALVTMCASLLTFSTFGTVGTLSTFSLALAAVVGAVAVLLLVLLIARRVRNNVTLLIVGMMIGSIAGALVSLIQNFSNPDALKLFIVWTLGSLSAVGWSELAAITIALLISQILILSLVKPLNGLLLGEHYARALGIRITRVRVGIVCATGLLAGCITAFCGLIAFVGVAVPHIARGLAGTTNHRITIPLSAIVGANLLLICDILSNAFTYPLPISTMSALFGAPIILWIILKK